MMIEKIRDEILASIEVKQLLLESEAMLRAIADVARTCSESLKKGGKILLCGNGGSAADAQHIAAELTGRFRRERKALHAEALHVNTSELTAIANDYGYDEVFSRLVMAKGTPGDVLIGISTSGKSPNILAALVQARRQRLTTIGMTGINTSQMGEVCDAVLAVPSNDTARIQEAHILIGHVLCEAIEEAFLE